MRRLLSVLLAVIVVVSVLGDAYAAKPRTQAEYDADFYKMGEAAAPYDPEKDPNRINSSPLDPSIRQGIKGRDAIINEQNAEQIRQSRQNAAGSQEVSYTQPASPQGGRKFQNGLQKWAKGAKYQLTNWTFDTDRVTVQLIDRSGKVERTYVPKKLNDGGFQLPYNSGGIPAGTQLFVPEGCLFCGNSEYVGVSKISRQPNFEAEEFVYYKKADPHYGFTIFPYYQYPLPDDYPIEEYTFED